MFKRIHVAKLLGFKLFTRATVTPSIVRNVCSDQKKDDDVKEPLDFNELKFSSKVPIEPHVSPISLVKIDRIEIDEETLKLLERLSLVNVDSK